MTNYADEKKIRKNSLQWTIDTSDFTEVTLLIYSLEIITKVGRYFPIFFSHWRSLNVLLANDLLENSIEFGILNSIFVAVDFISLIQMYQKIRSLHLIQVTTKPILNSSWILEIEMR